MWYLPMIAGLYLVIPIMKPITQDELTEKWFIVLGCIITILLPQISSMAPFFPFLKEFSDTL
jgi:surface polysaccharide O-acyltransferase-like enzyme